MPNDSEDKTKPKNKTILFTWAALISSLLITIPSVAAQADVTSSAQTAINESRVFKKWLTENSATFATCRPELKESSIHLCDGTQIPLAEAQKLFRMKTKEAVAYVKSNKIKLEILCTEKTTGDLHPFCQSKVSKKTFQEFGFLHGQFDAKTSTIFLRSDASHGSLIHELFHSKQFENKTPVLGRIYKKERLRIEGALNSAFDLILKEVQKAESSGYLPLATAMIPIAQELTSELASYSKWQMLIDEWNIFLTYKLYPVVLGIHEKDVELAKKNIAFICRDPRTRELLKNSQECTELPMISAE